MKSFHHHCFKSLTAILMAFVLVCATPGSSFAQTFSSGSTGADGAFTRDPIPDDRIGHAMVFDSNRNVVVLYGGSSSTSTWEWNGIRWTERQTINNPGTRHFHAMAFDSTRNVTVLFGGASFGGNAGRSETWEYDGTNWIQRSPVTTPSARLLHGMAFDAARQQIVMAGGVPTDLGNGSTPIDETWTYNGTDWTLLAPATSFGKRFRMHMAYDPVRQNIVSFGGLVRPTSSSASTSAFTQIWDGTNWVAQSPSQSPPSGIFNGAAFDVQNGQLIIFGPGGGTNQTWAWSGTNWSQIQSPNLPFRRANGAIAYDGARNQVVLFSGDITAGLSEGFPIIGASTEIEADTWLFANSDWTAPTNVQPEQVVDMASKADGVYNYTTVLIPEGIAIGFKPNAANTPVTWLATGDVVIDGVVTVKGESLNSNNGAPAPGAELKGGPGGFEGGLGGVRQSVSGTFQGTAGKGPGGGGQGVTQSEVGSGGSYGSLGGGSQPGAVYGSILVQPLIGGSGGGGGGSTVADNGFNGTGGGGAILISSSSAVRVSGAINANGGDASGSSRRGGPGSGGAIRIVAPTVAISGELSARRGMVGTSASDTEGVGRIRIEALTSSITGSSIVPANTFAPTTNVALPNQATITITSVAGVNVTQSNGSTNSPDVVFNEGGTAVVNLATTNVPQGTVITVTVRVGGQVVSAQSSPVDASGNASASLVVPGGVGTIEATASFQSP